MKRAIIAFACMLFCTMHLSAQTVDDLFKEFKNKENVEYIEIPKVMMSMASGLVKKEDGGDLVKKMEEKKMEERTFGIDTVEYRDAYLKNLMGK